MPQSEANAGKADGKGDNKAGKGKSAKKPDANTTKPGKGTTAVSSTGASVLGGTT